MHSAFISKAPLNQGPVVSGYHVLHSDGTADATDHPVLLLPVSLSSIHTRVEINYAMVVTGPTPEKADASKQEMKLQGRAKRDEWTDEWGY